MGCLFQGVLEIYGTTNRLIAVYPGTGAVLLIAGLESGVHDIAVLDVMMPGMNGFDV